MNAIGTRVQINAKVTPDCQYNGETGVITRIYETESGPYVVVKLDSIAYVSVPFWIGDVTEIV